MLTMGLACLCPLRPGLGHRAHMHHRTLMGIHKQILNHEKRLDTQGIRQCRIQDILNNRQIAVQEIWAIGNRVPIRNGNN